MPTRILIVEDDTGLNQMLALHFEDQGLETACVGNCKEARERLQAQTFELILLDQQLPDGLGIDLLRDIRRRYPDQPIIMMTGRHDLELAIDAIKTGAAEFVHKPIRTEELQAVVDRVLQSHRLAQRSSPSAQRQAPAPGPARDLIGKSQAMLAVSKEIALCAASQASVLITGESGTGKEVVARLIHQHSGRSGAFVAVNCAAIVDTLLESELFGHEKGAFTGAVGRKPGRFEQARGGTLFLDEVGELAPPLQAKLLRALQERMFERVGGTEPIHTDARVLAATNRDLFAEARAGRFREDLIYRLNVVSIQLPPLRRRREDIPLLAAALLEKVAAAIGRSGLTLTPETLNRLMAHDWPGNVRELENVLTQAAVHARSGVITPDLVHFLDLPPAPEESAPVQPVPTGPPADPLRTLDAVEAEHIQRVLDHTGGHKGRTSRILGISRPALDRKILKYGLTLPHK
jgi:DNA-binding NtrC family response regulator